MAKRWKKGMAYLLTVMVVCNGCCPVYGKAAVTSLFLEKTIASGNASGEASGNASGEACSDASAEAVPSNPYEYSKVPRWYAIQYHLNGGGDNSNPAVYRQGDEVVLSSPVRKGYQFEGWYLDAAMNGTSLSAITPAMSGPIHLYARWSRVTYSVTYQYSGGKKVAENPSSYHYKEKTIVLKPSSRSGYQFAGWYRVDIGEKISKISNTMCENLVLQAKWTKVTLGKVTSVKLKSEKSKLKIQIKKVSKAKGYEYQYWKKGTKKRGSAITTQRNYTLLKLSPGKKYCVRVRAYTYDSCGKKVYGKYSKTSCVIVKN